MKEVVVVRDKDRGGKKGGKKKTGGGEARRGEGAM